MLDFDDGTFIFPYIHIRYGYSLIRHVTIARFRHTLPLACIDADIFSFRHFGVDALALMA